MTPIYVPIAFPRGDGAEPRSIVTTYAAKHPSDRPALRVSQPPRGPSHGRHAAGPPLRPRPHPLPRLPWLDLRRRHRRARLHTPLLLPQPPFYWPPAVLPPPLSSPPPHPSPRVRRPRPRPLPPRPPAYRDPAKVELGVAKALEFYSWVESRCGFLHDELTCREMSRVLAKANRLPTLWRFLRSNETLVGTATVTSVINILGEEGLTGEALAAFYRMKQLHCKPDVQCYNTVILALCRVGDFKKARFLLDQMEMPGARCPPDTFTYTILISFYCKRSLQTGCRKAIRRRIWEANHMFRRMVLKGFVPDVVTYNCLIDGLCKTYRIERAHELFDDMLLKGCSPNRVTYNSFIRYYSAVNEVDKAIEMMREMLLRKHGTPTSSSYTPIIHSLCEAGRVGEARDFLMEMVDSGSIPREFTYNLVCNALSSAGQEDLPDELHRRIEEGIDARFRWLMQIKPVMGGRTRSPLEQM